MAPHVTPGGVTSRRGRRSCFHRHGTPVLVLVASLLVVLLVVREYNLLRRVFSWSAQSHYHSEPSPARLHAPRAGASYRRALRELMVFTAAENTIQGGTSRIAGKTAAEAEVDEKRSIMPIDIPLLQDPDGFRLPGNGISLESLGEPKSGTTWLGRLVPSLALELCGSSNNLWCEMGGLVVHPNNPAPWYEFEMLKTATSSPGEGGDPTLYLHYSGHMKHIIPGMDRVRMFGEDTRGGPGECHGGYPHHNGFEDHPPCISSETPTRKLLRDCLWDTSEQCVQHTASPDPAVRRSIVIFRDPRDVVLSAYKMRTRVFCHAWVQELSEEDYIRTEFETLVSWLHQRWTWHTSTDFAPSSHVVYYEEAQESHEGLVGIAAFMGLECTDEQAFKVWDVHRSPSRHRNFTTRGLSAEIIEFMTAAMARLLPPPLARRWGVTPTDLPRD